MLVNTKTKNNYYYDADVIGFLDYYPFGSPMPSRHTVQTSSDVDQNGNKVYRYGFNGQENDFEVHNKTKTSTTATFWQYDSRLGRRWNTDPAIKVHESPYATFANNPISFTDPNGADTVDISVGVNGVYSITKKVLAEGDDVFRVDLEGDVTTFTFGEGEYGNRVNALNLESNSDYTLGVYFVSGSLDKKGGIGFYVTPGGEASTKLNSNKRLPDGYYNLIESGSGAKWVMPWVTSDGDSEVKSRGIKWHPALSATAKSWTKGCFVIFPSYKMGKCSPKIKAKNADELANDFAILLGATATGLKKVGKYCRNTSDFEHTDITKLVVKSFWNNAGSDRWKNPSETMSPTHTYFDPFINKWTMPK